MWIQTQDGNAVPTKRDVPMVIHFVVPVLNTNRGGLHVGTSVLEKRRSKLLLERHAARKEPTE
ncbi:hypothetical protein K227x_21830 [Rubripirellula lacrimiformis]|uniref:Uncharacterized protein n=1 Tax=Rubripirellula lacrimiformis TaxID=1930273 RepID=A0A517N9W7_9BACT|nr:hypothetical protein K227x_21830 [Rubripirellula lacrimiformis]